MAQLDALLDLIPTADIAKKLGIPEVIAEAAVQQVLPGLVSGLAKNAESKTGAASLEKALEKHRNSGVLSGPGGKSVRRASIDTIDTADGKKIVGKVFGTKTDDVAHALAKNSPAAEVTGEIIKQVLPIIAPIVLSWLASQFLGGGSTSTVAAEKPSAKSSGGIGDMLGDLVSSKQGQDMIGSLIGGLLSKS